MHVKRYEVSSINEALTRIKSDLGPDAIILSSKKIRGINNEQKLEVLAAKDEQASLPENPFGKKATEVKLSSTGNNEDIFNFFRGELNELKEIVRHSQKNQRGKNLSHEIEELKETMDKFFDVLGMQKRKSDSGASREVYCHLLANGFSRSAACRILDAVKLQATEDAESGGYAGSLKLVEDYIIGSLSKVPEKKKARRIKAFVGPTGVGKTTTIAKLAANFSMMHNMNVGMITTDTFRIAATEQLRTYARIMNIRMEVASGEESMQKALRTFSDKDIILVDTPGRGRFDDGYLKYMENLINIESVEKNLLIPATASEDNLQDVINNYSNVNYDYLIVTKIDEARRFGILYDILEKAKKPVTYMTNGQNVPQDIERATPHKISSLIMGNILH